MLLIQTYMHEMISHMSGRLTPPAACFAGTWVYVYGTFNPATLSLASSISAIPGLASFQRESEVHNPALMKYHEWSDFS
jgi:hypothetical protein